MATFQLHNVYFTPGSDIVGIALRASSGLAGQSGVIHDLYTSQAALTARACERLGVPDATWGDEDVRAEAAEQLAAIGDVLEGGA